MSTGMIIAVIVVVAALVLAATLVMRGRGRQGGPDLKRRFGPEYQRTVARHDGDAKAAERELTERLERHGKLRERPLEPAEREQYSARWTAVQERFVEAPREAVAEADRLLSDLAAFRGYPEGGRYEEQVAALSVHHAQHVEGYRRVHRVGQAGPGAGAGESAAGTEELRTALMDARALFDDLMNDSTPATGHRSETATGTGDDTRHQSSGKAGMFGKSHPRGV
ncbi:hypothetical protein [Streptomyces sp. NPDC048720]|uniref:hypothetical protein n=1 Tax=Streptomyces sp. NPDC048720 TaxID=3365588 RepID=UPI00371D6BE1